MFRFATVFEPKRAQSQLCDKIFVLEFEEIKSLWLLSILNLQAAVLLWVDVDRHTGIYFHQQTLPEGNPNFSRPFGLKSKKSEEAK